MAKTTNRIQSNYMKAKALVDTLKAQAQQIEQDYIREHGIVNADGTTPTYIWTIDNEETFNQANETTAPVIDSIGLGKAERILHETENDLIRFGLSLAPTKVRNTLHDRCFGLNGHYAHVDIRKKCIDLAFRLDVSTLPKGVANY